jgi:hypothetical protein
METTLRDLCSRLETLEETFLLELLKLNSSDLVARFEDIIENDMEYLLSELEQIPVDDEEIADDE